MRTPDWHSEDTSEPPDPEEPDEIEPDYDAAYDEAIDRRVNQAAQLIHEFTQENNP